MRNRGGETLGEMGVEEMELVDGEGGGTGGTGAGSMNKICYFHAVLRRCGGGLRKIIVPSVNTVS